jgi:hypothetical protein
MNLGFIILAHDQPHAIRRLAGILAIDGNRVVVHFDSSAPDEDKQALNRLAEENPGRITVLSKVHCVWGEWSLVEAVLISLREFEKMPDPPDYIHLMSGADYPLRPVGELKEFLRLNPKLDFIESFDISKGSWVKGGLCKERFHFYFPFNFRTYRKGFDFMVRWQRRLKIRRQMPLGLKPHMGSQWWTLRWSTCKKVLDFTAENPAVPRFFKSTWIPDESYFQTLVARLVPPAEVANLQLMFHHLTSAGRPYVFYNDHLTVLRRLPHFFVRKISPRASLVFDALDHRKDDRRRIPSLKLLAKVRTLIGSRIDQNYKLSGSAPGHPEGHRAQLRTTNRFFIVVFLTDASQLRRLEEVVAANPVFFWLGRPYSPKSVRMPEDARAQLGMNRAGWQLRDKFPFQFVHHLLEITPQSRIPVAAILAPDVQPDLAALGSLELLLPFLVKTSVLETMVASRRISSAASTTNSQFGERLIHVDLDQLIGMLDEIAEEFRRTRGGIGAGESRRGGKSTP